MPAGALDRTAKMVTRNLILIAFNVSSLIPQPVLSNVFPPAEFAARRAEVMNGIVSG